MKASYTQKYTVAVHQEFFTKKIDGNMVEIRKH